MSTPPVTPMTRQAAPTMSRQATPPMVFMSTPYAHSFSAFYLGSPSTQPPAQLRSSTRTKRKVTTNRIPVGPRDHVMAHGLRERTIMQGIDIYANEAT
ncbi:hypothetical protein V6N13_082474 [Hibiscus sabdariffa]|uniref:Uncharacterized protein n=1 Tax=Hibiscus sabdariffa TaxID=183260 RepID=A0ABR2Q481_9ROSI